jgi:glycosyltransferase involved in cell wall biosynthesis
MTTSRQPLAVVQLPISPLGPRARRAAELAKALEREWEIIRWPPNTNPIGRSGSSSRAAQGTRALLRSVAGALLLDRHELRCRRALRQFPADVAGAVLVGPPFSPVAVVARALAAQGAPYVLDIGDPWVLTAPGHKRLAFARLWRPRRAEYRTWAGAEAAIVTTKAQADALHTIFPSLPILVRPNGYETIAMVPAPIRRSSHNLSIVFYGNFYESLDPDELRILCEKLVDSGVWEEISFTQYGRDWNRTLARLPAAIHVQQLPPVPWEDVVLRAGNYDVALVCGAWDGRKLPSKAIPYLTLPIPRLALCGDQDNTLAEYVRDKPGFLLVTPEDEAVGERLKAHLSYGWTAEELAPPRGESWEAVAPMIADFATEHLRQSSERKR